jgi:dATP pyrophosphohydrolase
LALAFVCVLGVLSGERFPVFQSPGVGPGGDPHAGSAGAAAGAGRSSRLLAVGDRQPAGGHEIFPEWRWRYAPGVTRNTEHAFGLQLPEPLPIALAPREHLTYRWMPYDLAAQKVFSWSNAALLRALPELVTNQGRA